MANYIIIQSIRQLWLRSARTSSIRSRRKFWTNSTSGLGQLLHEHLADSLEQALGRPLQLHCWVQLPHDLLEELVAPAVGQYLGSVVVVSEGVDVLAHFLLKHGLAAALGLADLSQLGLDCIVVLPLVDLVELVVDELIRRHGACFLVIRH